ncbi:hypothetical protein [Bacillus sp. FSL K6-3431]|uniref:hypothetical protein n=1 Tax=Bacillus sp. FSL K6-3431 TaxID=2921500 RepID=UPI0030F5714E
MSFRHPYRIIQQDWNLVFKERNTKFTSGNKTGGEFVIKIGVTAFITVEIIWLLQSRLLFKTEQEGKIVDIVEYFHKDYLGSD